MKCWNCHHLNNASDAECFMCGAVLYSGTPKAHGSLYVFVALCVFLPVFSAAGGILHVLPHFGVNASQLRAGGAPGIIPWILGTAGISACLYVTRTPFPLKVQLLLSALVVLVCWGAYIGFSVGLAKELTAPRHAVGAVPSAAVTLRA
ncbi:hypothetical protein [Limnoglobus roseus]|uniref:Uncharacterized protein n=1 Tax=Limnoglobus roseus TaxID=2598579 RepID=A0A5C1A5F3_9BACT|nr:hypothetical protein [Limnoglobus roseus]QEL14369.1 hypothetical protein PX52LOC_01257 [Limnoglobus roseus]